MDVLENVYKDSKNPINLAITYMENEELEVNLESFSEEQKCELNALFQQLHTISAISLLLSIFSSAFSC